MIAIELTQADLWDIRFAYSPLLELTMSRRVMLLGRTPFGFGRWMDEAQRALYNLRLPYFDALVSMKGYIPDFMTPTPENTRTRIEDDLEMLRATDPELVRLHIERALAITKMELTDILREFMIQTDQTLEKLVQEMRLYWRMALEGHWSRLVSVLEKDVLYRARRLALEGISGVFDDLHPELRLANPVQIQIFHNLKGRENVYGETAMQLKGTGIQLVPVLFNGQGLHYQFAPEYQPMLLYSPRGIGNWMAGPAEPEPALEVALGAGRARVLMSLLTPSNTGEISQRLQLTAGAVSQHLGKLREAGLVEAQRSGKRVYYHLTERGEQLLTLFA